jgi:subtilisin-like proprotein convertase family protein
MKNLLYILLFVPLALFGQDNDPCYSINDYNLLTQEANLPVSLDLLSGWNMIGYSCINESDILEIFSPISDKIVIAKNNNGSVYMPEFGFNGIGNLLPNQGYQIKMSEAVIGFELCSYHINYHQVGGCTDCEAVNFNRWATSDNGSCEYNNCTDSSADNYGETLPCIYYGCNDPLAANYDPYANTDDGSCVVAEACPYENYLEYSPDAISYNANLCVNIIVEGCTDNTALNYNSDANVDDNSCEFIYGCIDQEADNYNAEATTDDGSCIYYGCMDPTAGNYDELANTDDGTCLIGGCKNPTASNYNPDAEIDDGSCIIYGCLLSDFPNYNSVANTDDGSCDMNSLDVFGCTDVIANNYQEIANIDNGSCLYFLIFSNTNSSFLNDGGVFNSNIVIDDNSNIILNDTTIISIHINIEHSYLGDLSIFLTSPNGAQVMLIDQFGQSTWLGEASDNGNTNTVGYDYGWSMNPTYFGTMQDGVEGGNTISLAVNPWILNSDTYLPLESLNEFSGINLNGIWTLTIIDNFEVDDGYLFSWSIHVPY